VLLPNRQQCNHGAENCSVKASLGLSLSLTQERPEHGGRDRHVCIEIEGDIDALVAQLEVYNVQYTRSKSGRQACFFRDLDSNTVEVAAIN
jgi:hypothetical protein